MYVTGLKGLMLDFANHH